MQSPSYSGCRELLAQLRGTAGDGPECQATTASLVVPMAMAESLGDDASLRRTRGDAAEVFFPVRVLPLVASFGLAAKAFASTASGSHDDADEAGQLLLLASAFLAVAHDSPTAMFLGLRALSAFLKRVDSVRDAAGDSALPFLDSSAVVAGITSLACDIGERIAWCTSEVVEVARGRAKAEPVSSGKPLAWVLSLADNLFEGIAELLRFARKSSCRHAAVERMERRRLASHPRWRSAVATAVARTRAAVEAGAAESRAAVSTSAARLLSRFLLLERATRSLEASVVSSEGGFARQGSMLSVTAPDGASAAPSDADAPPPRLGGPPPLAPLASGGRAAASDAPPQLRGAEGPLLPSLADARGPGHGLSWDRPVPGVTWSDVGAPGWATAASSPGSGDAEGSAATVKQVCVAAIGGETAPSPPLAWVDMARRLSAVVLTGLLKAASSDPPLFALLCARQTATALCDVLDDGRSAYRFAVLSAGALHGTPRTGGGGALGTMPPRLSALARRKLEAAQIIGAMGRRATSRAGAEAAGTSVLPLRRWFVAARRALRRSLPPLPVIDTSDSASASSSSFALLPPCKPVASAQAKAGRVSWAAIPHEELACLAEALGVFMETMDENKAGAAASAGSGMAGFCVRVLASVLQLPLYKAAEPSAPPAVLRRRIVSLDHILQSCLFAVANTAMVPAARSTLHAAGAFAIAQAAIVGAEAHSQSPSGAAGDAADRELAAAAGRAQAASGSGDGNDAAAGPRDGEAFSAFLERAAPAGQRMWHAALLPVDQPDRALRLVQLANVMGCIAPVTTEGEGAFVGRRIALRVAAELCSAATGSSDTSSAHEIAFTVWTLSLNEGNRLEFVRAGAHHSLCTVVADEESELETRVVAAHALARLAPRLAAASQGDARRRRSEAAGAFPASVGDGKRATAKPADLRTVVGKRMLLVKARLQAERLRARQTGSDWLEDDDDVDDDSFAGNHRPAGGLNLGSLNAALSQASDSDSSSDSEGPARSGFAATASSAGSDGALAGTQTHASRHRLGFSGSRLLAPGTVPREGSTVHWSRRELLSAAMASSELGQSAAALANAVDGVLFACNVDLEHYTSSRLRSILVGHGDAAPSESEFSVGLPAIGPSVSRGQPLLNPLSSVPEDGSERPGCDRSEQGVAKSVGFESEVSGEASDGEGIDEELKLQVVRPPPALPSEFKFDVMISYSWARLETPRRIAKGLAERGFRVWLDIEQMHGSLIQRMAEAITSSRAVVVFRCPEYVQSTNCQRELEFAAMQRRAIVPVLLEPHSTDNWLGLLIGSALYLDMRPAAMEPHGDSCYEYSVSSVVEQLSKLGVFPSGGGGAAASTSRGPQQANPAPAPAPAPAPPSTPASAPAPAPALAPAFGSLGTRGSTEGWVRSAGDSPLLRAGSGDELAALLESNGLPPGTDCSELTGAGLRVVLQLWEADRVACTRLLLSGDLGISLPAQRLLQLVHAAQLAELGGSP
ncbi:hypothetical protein FNF27_00540 [Cafeteria roenbergensis]|uniref:TIR domain-containing protein n=1 Tax=Cafeteria roenbergensis TaxID=33653 RepID=A0A5A8EKH8_CAFRO|nr:hypothetical protein FNF27_00540 [Cafeteria roenbergensis]